MRDVCEVDHGKLAHALLQLSKPRIDEDLALFGHVVLGVFAEIAQRDGLLDLGRKLGGQFVFERFDLFSKLGFDVFGHFRKLPSSKGIAGKCTGPESALGTPGRHVLASDYTQRAFSACRWQMCLARFRQAGGRCCLQGARRRPWSADCGLRRPAAGPAQTRARWA